MIIGIQFDEINLDEADATDKVMKDFDTSRDTKLDLQEFIAGILRWLDEARHSVASSNCGPNIVKYLDDFHEQTKREHNLLGDQSDEVVEGVKNLKKINIKAVLLLLLGTLIATAFADPLVDAVDNFSDAISIPTFFISFIGLPLATSSEAVSAIIFASTKKQRSASQTFSEGTSRPLSYASSSGLISDGTDDRVESNQTSIDFLLKEEWITMFLLLQKKKSYLLFHGESYVASGGERIFKILGPGIFGASAFQVIGSLPEA
ncbi:hypothetical protein C3L33_10022, partial [Rhododendron williamsianum]